jgi:hypothetical protein
MAIPAKCEICMNRTNLSFGFGTGLHYYCAPHKDEIFAKVAGKKLKTASKPKIVSKPK